MLSKFTKRRSSQSLLPVLHQRLPFAVPNRTLLSLLSCRRRLRRDSRIRRVRLGLAIQEEPPPHPETRLPSASNHPISKPTSATSDMRHSVLNTNHYGQYISTALGSWSLPLARLGMAGKVSRPTSLCFGHVGREIFPSRRTKGVQEAPEKPNKEPWR